MAAGLRIEIRGRVQGVGFRPWVHGLAQRAALRGRVWNHERGVTVEAFGPAPALRAFAAALRHPPAPAARVRELRSHPIPFEPLPGFTVEESRGGGARSASIAPDWATCDACRAELGDPADRRHGYPFVNCTWCGPRYTLCLDVPYDRDHTTMAAFAMCRDCRREYEDPADRRFHAEPNACPVCGPHLWLEADERGRFVAATPGDPLAEAAALLAGGRIVAVKGLGGFHLACDATADAAVARLRVRKQRDEKPFAVMVGDAETAARLAVVGARERALLRSGERPIVLLRRRAGRRPDGARLAAGVAPDSPLLGLMLPYTPLHELLLRTAGRPLVMTSANLSDEPMVCGNVEARARLDGIADALLLHDREIANRCDDSVARVVGRQPLLVRRARGHVPAAFTLARPVSRPLLACGAHLKNAFCLAAGDQAWLGPHIGDLETDEACRAFEESVERFQRFTGIAPEAIAHDLHPDYFTTRWALEQRAPLHLGVQHHHAHVASCMAEHGLEGPVLGLAWDGTGYGPDGHAWGGELLFATEGDYERLATFRPIPLAGGERAIRQVWRAALALLDQAFEGDPPLARLALFERIDAGEIETVRRMIAGGLNSPAAHGVGRFFDAFGALALGRAEARHEGQVAVHFAELARGRRAEPYPFACAPDVDLRPAMRAAVEALLCGERPAAISARFHATLVAAGAALVRRALERRGRLPVVLSGGCFQNPALVTGLRRALRDLDVYGHVHVPPGDGGIALGQIAVADARLRRGA